MKQLYTILILGMAALGSSFITRQVSFSRIGEGMVQPKVIRFYPNPATTMISFEFDKSVDKNYTLQVYNFIGQKMTEIRITESKLTINLDENYFRGIYIYQLRDLSGRIVESGKFQVSK